MSITKGELLEAATNNAENRDDVVFTVLEKEICKLGFAEGAYWALNKLYQDKEILLLLAMFKLDVLRNHYAQITNVDTEEWFNNNKTK